ncbi:MAG TPA: bacterial transcriptional activator domain-containing protein [Planktothrix sp.]|jgi:tetratricopeptide (TPR) repeat protein
MSDKTALLLATILLVAGGSSAGAQIGRSTLIAEGGFGWQSQTAPTPAAPLPLETGASATGGVATPAQVWGGAQQVTATQMQQAINNANSLLKADPSSATAAAGASSGFGSQGGVDAGGAANPSQGFGSAAGIGTAAGFGSGAPAGENSGFGSGAGDGLSAGFGSGSNVGTGSNFVGGNGLNMDAGYGQGAGGNAPSGFGSGPGFTATGSAADSSANGDGPGSSFGAPTSSLLGDDTAGSGNEMENPLAPGIAHGGSKMDTPIHRALSELKAGHYDASIAKLDQILTANPGNGQAHYLKAIAYVNTRHYAQAAEEYRAAIRCSPNSELSRLSAAGLIKLTH